MFLLQQRSTIERRPSADISDEKPPSNFSPTLRVQDWKYIAEGGANVIYRYQGTDEPEFYGRLLRIKKCDVPDDVVKPESTRKLKRKSSKGHNNVQPHYPLPQRVLEYATKDILPYLARQTDDVEHRRSRYLQVAERMDVSREFLSELNDSLLSLESRPNHRRQSQIDVSLECVMVLPDVTLPPRSAALEDSETEVSEEEEQELHAVDSLSVIPDADMDDDSDSDSSSPSPRLSGPPRSLRRMLSSAHQNVFDCCFRNLSIELKPKIGFKPLGPYTPDAKKRVCRFCMHQHLKLSAKKVAETSGYCPLDLFSRDRSRVKRALQALQQTPQNNFKVFLRSQDDTAVDVLTGLSADALPKGASQKYSYCRSKKNGSWEQSCQSLASVLPKHSSMKDQDLYDRAHQGLLPDVVELITEVLVQLDVLEDLKKLQQLDHITVDGVWHVQELLRKITSLELSEEEEKDMPLDTAVDKYLSTLEPSDREWEEMEEGAGSVARSVTYINFALTKTPDLSDALRQELTVKQTRDVFEELLQRFRVATTLKDCSLLINLRRSSSESSTCDVSKPQEQFEHLREFEHPISFRNMVFNCVPAVVDLDVKSHKSLQDYRNLDLRILRHFVEHVGVPEDVQCVE